ncbi:hypothetical protein KAR91_48970 [Candidatus Pacearchaeota archaeon]|nr:hypothetical protein [Candidatus Pacearchaeota archaeon]
MTPEQNFWKLIKLHLPGDVSRIENVADVGTPDVSGAYQGKDYWIELKVCKNKIKITEVTSILRIQQISWHMRRSEHGSLIFVAIYYPNIHRIIFYQKNHEHKMYIPVINMFRKKGFNWGDFEHQFKILIREPKWSM